MALLGVCFACANLFAQTPPPRPSYRFSVLALTPKAGEGNGTLYFLGANNQMIEVKLRANARSEPIVVPAPNKPIVLSIKNPEPKPGVPLYAPVAQLTWPNPKSHDALFLISQDTAAPAKVKALVLDDSPIAFPVHGIRLVNASGVSLTARINSFTGEIANGALSNLIAYPDMSAVDANSSVRYPFGLAVKKDGVLETNHSGFLEASKNTRTLVIVQPPQAGNDRLKTKIIIDKPSFGPK